MKLRRRSAHVPQPTALASCRRLARQTEAGADALRVPRAAVTGMESVGEANGVLAQRLKVSVAATRRATSASGRRLKGGDAGATLAAINGAVDQNRAVALIRRRRQRAGRFSPLGRRPLRRWRDGRHADRARMPRDRRDPKRRIVLQHSAEPGNQFGPRRALPAGAGRPAAGCRHSRQPRHVPQPRWRPGSRRRRLNVAVQMDPGSAAAAPTPSTAAGAPHADQKYDSCCSGRAVPHFSAW